MKVNIRDLMDNIEDSSVNLKEDVVSTERIKEMTMKKVNNNSVVNNTAKRNSKKTAVVAAIAVALVAGMGITSYAAFGGGIESVLFETGPSSAVQAAPEGADTSNMPATCPTVIGPNGDPVPLSEKDLSNEISVQGFNDSPEFLASKEWNQFTLTYDTDWAVLNKVGNGPTEWDEKYGAYNVYSQEMADKIDEITSKYGLALHSSKCITADQDGIEEKFGVLMNKATYVGYYYEDGTFQVDGDYGENGEFPFQLRRTVKGVLDTVSLGVANANDYEQWTYTTKSGVTVMLAMVENETGVMIADCGESFVVLNALIGWSDSTMDKAQFEEWAERTHFENF